MTEAFSINREFDFVRLEGLRRATGRPAHEWDVYIVKELIDNALDADETLWQQDPTQFPDVKVRVEYIHIPERQSRQLFVQVQNRALFPVDQLEEVFATHRYTSSKTFIKGLTRGALGNALKTLLGIPYALHNRATGNWRPELKPMSIVCQGQKYLPRYLIDRTAQVIHFECAQVETQMQPGTVISVGVDAFDQERPRTLADLQQLATHYHLVNPHARFRWTVEIGDDEWTHSYGSDPNWHSKYQGLTPVQWYFAAAFQDLLSALYRNQFGADDSQALPVTTVTEYFAGFAWNSSDLIAHLEQDRLYKADIEGEAAIRLYRLLVQHSPRFEAFNLGQVGPDHLRQVLSQALPVKGELLYARISEDSDPGIPFVLEAAAAYLAEGAGREVWTAVNSAPTYNDPFIRAWLHAPAQPDDPVLGLRGLLDAYGHTEETPLVLFLHLICPNVEHSEFSKSDVNHLPFKQALGALLDDLLTQLQQTREELELRLQEMVFQVLNDILEKLGAHERFIPSQLLEKLKTALSQNVELTTWLTRPEAESRLRAYIASYQSHDTLLAQRVARPPIGTLTIPLHPERYFSLLVGHVTRDLLAHNHVNKILYVQGRELEPVVIENNWLCQMDMALLHNLPDPEGLRNPLVLLASRCELPILILHDATEMGQELVPKMRQWLGGAAIDQSRLVELGLVHAEGIDQSPTRLVEMMPGELATWLTGRLATLNIPAKWLPDVPQIRRDIRQQVEQSIQATIWEGMGQQLAWNQLLKRLDQELALTATMMQEELDEQVQDRLKQVNCADSYAVVLDEVVKQFHTRFMRQCSDKLQTVVKAHMIHVRDQWT